MTAAVLLLCAIVAGGYMAGTEEEGVSDVGPNIAGAHLACGTMFPECGSGKFLPFGNNRLTDIHLTHRVFVYLATIAIIVLLTVAFARGSPRPPARAGGVAPVLPVHARRAERLARRARAADRRPPGHRDTALGGGDLDRVPARLAPSESPARERAAPGRGIGGRGMSVISAPVPIRARERGGLAASQVSVTPGDARLRTMRAAIGVANDYVALTKPRIISLLLLTCVATMFVADPGGPALATILWTCLGGYLAAGGAGAINHYIEREHRRAHGAHRRAARWSSGRIEPRRGARLRDHARGRRVRAALDHGQRLTAALGDGGAARLRLRLHALAEAAHAAEHRARRSGGRGAAAGRLGGRDGRPHPRGALARSRSSSSGHRRTSGRSRC